MSLREQAEVPAGHYRARADDPGHQPARAEDPRVQVLRPRRRPGARRERVRRQRSRGAGALRAQVGDRRSPPECTELAGSARALRRPLYVIAYGCMSDAAITLVGPRVRALREAGGWSLRDLADRCGVSAPMLSQVERGETSPTLQVAARIARGLDLRLSQLLRLDEDGAVSIVRRGERRTGGAGGHRYEILTPPLPGQRAEVSRHALAPGAATGGPGDPPMHEPGARETAVVERGAVRLHIDGARARPLRRRLRDLRRRPAPPLREPRKGGGRPAGRRVGGAAPLMSPTTLFEKIWAAHEVAPGLRLHRPPPRPRGHQPAGLRRPAAGRPPRAPAGPHARHRRPQRPDGRDARRRPDPRRALSRPGGDARAQLRGVRHPDLLASAPSGRASST